MKTAAHIIAALLTLAACVAPPSPSGAEETETAEAEDFRDSCYPGFCCTESKPWGESAIYQGCTASTGEADCVGGSYLSCEAECYNGEGQCHVGPNFNECCG